MHWSNEDRKLLGRVRGPDGEKWDSGPSQDSRRVGSDTLEKVDLTYRPMPTCLAVCPRDINIMLIGYEGGIVAYDFRQAMPVKTFEMTLPPGAPGGGTYDDANVRSI